MAFVFLLLLHKSLFNVLTDNAMTCYDNDICLINLAIANNH